MSAPALAAVAAVVALVTRLAAAGEAVPGKAVAPAASSFQTAKGEVTAVRPAGGDWTCRPFGRSGGGFTLAEVTCRRDAPELLLYAKAYAGPKETLDGLCAQDWAEYFKELFPALPKVVTRRLVLSGRPTCAVEVRGLTAAGPPTLVREWYAVAPGHVLVISAAGPADAMDAAAGVVEAWRDGVTFAAAPGPAAGPAPTR